MGGMTDWPASPAARLRVIDLETTGDSFRNGGVVEVGWQDLAPDAGRALGAARRPRVAAGAAGLPDLGGDLRRAPHRGRGRGERAGLDGLPPDILQGDGIVALAAHRAAFEKRWCLPRLSGRARWICTYKCALRLWPDAPSHSNQGLRYWRRPAGLDRATGLPAHRAGPDAYVTAHHLRDMLALASVAQLLAWSEQPALLVRVPSGALRGRRWDELDDAQLDRVLAGEWGQNQDMLFTAREERARRSGGAPPAADQMRLLLDEGR